MKTFQQRNVSRKNNNCSLRTVILASLLLLQVLKVHSFSTPANVNLQVNPKVVQVHNKFHLNLNSNFISNKKNRFQYPLYNSGKNVDDAALLELGKNDTSSIAIPSEQSELEDQPRKLDDFSILTSKNIIKKEELMQDMSSKYINDYFPMNDNDNNNNNNNNNNNGNENNNNKKSRFLSALPSIQKNQLRGDEMDQNIIKTAVPSMLNMAVVPIVNSVDTFWVGRLGIALALAGQAAANQAFFTLFFLVSFLPTITAPLVATAVGSGDTEEAQTRVCEAIFLSNILGALGTILLVGFPRTSLGLVLSKDAAAMSYAVPYLRFRALSMIPALISATGFSAYRGLLNTVTPLKVSLTTNLINLVADPLLISGFGVSGAALATAGAEGISGLIYLKLLMKRNLLKVRKMFQIPKWSSLKPLVQGGSAMLLFQMVLNVAFLTAARRVQAMDPTGVSAAAYGITMQLYSVGVVCHIGMKATAATLIPSEKAKNGEEAARKMADKLFVWGSIVGIILGIAQMAVTPILTPMFTTIPEVREAIKVPALITAFIQFANGPLFVGEGVMVGMGRFKALASCTIIGASVMIASILSPLGKTLNGVLFSLAAFNLIQSIAMVWHHLKIGPFSKMGAKDKLKKMQGV